MATEKQPTVIKKYANRRLYHTGTSTYVTLDDLAGMVKACAYGRRIDADRPRDFLGREPFELDHHESFTLLLGQLVQRA